MKKFILGLILLAAQGSFAKCNSSQSWAQATTVEAAQWIAGLTVGHQLGSSLTSTCEIELSDETQKEGKFFLLTVTEKVMGVATKSLSFAGVGDLKSRVCDETNEVLAIGDIKGDRYMSVVFDEAYGEPRGLTITNAKTLESIKCNFVK